MSTIHNFHLFHLHPIFSHQIQINGWSLVYGRPFHKLSWKSIQYFFLDILCTHNKLSGHGLGN